MNGCEDWSNGVVDGWGEKPRSWRDSLVSLSPVVSWDEPPGWTKQSTDPREEKRVGWGQKVEDGFKANKPLPNLLELMALLELQEAPICSLPPHGVILGILSGRAKTKKNSEPLITTTKTITAAMCLRLCPMSCEMG